MKVPIIHFLKKYRWALTLLLIYVVWHLALVIVAYFGYSALPANPENTGYYLTREKGALMAITHDMWANWDGGIYRHIAELGYDKPLYLAFFPLYPLLIKGTAIVMQAIGFSEPYLRAGLFVAFWSFFAALLLLFKLIKERFSEKIAWTTVLVTLFFPTAFFFKALYT